MKLYNKIVLNNEQLKLFKDMLLHIDNNNEDKLTLNENLWIDRDEFKRYQLFYNQDISCITHIL
jgi:hypothetical protein